MATKNSPVTGDTPIAIKITVNDSLKKLKLPFKDLGADVLTSKLRPLLGATSDQSITLERFSDSAGGYVLLDPSNPSAFKTLIRAAKAKQKLRLKATIPSLQVAQVAPVFSALRTTAQPAVLAKMAQAQQPTIEELFAKAHKTADNLTKDAESPVIARTPDVFHQPRHSTAIDNRSVGPGIFDFNDSRASIRVKQEEKDEKVAVKNDHNSENTSVTASPTWSVYCNECDAVMTNVHFHCSVCDGGDYDLCESCVNSGKLCPGEGHWLVKRFIKNGNVISSTTERLPPKKKQGSGVHFDGTKTEIPIRTQIPVTVESVQEMPGRFVDDAKALNEDTLAPVRTCNCCVSVKQDADFVTCQVCEDYDLCFTCHVDNKHGHHPAHEFGPAVSGTKLSLVQQSLLPAGRNTRHAAICDGCNTNIYGVRHKCFNCPDFDYCNKCVKEARLTHPHHRFAPIYEPIAWTYKPAVRHHGIFCDGAACTSKPHQTYIEGIRYKCVVCNDTDFCADCEAMPGNTHNQTHPLIKIKTPIKGLNVSTVNETPQGQINGLGDASAVTAGLRPQTRSTTAVSSPNTTSSVQTVADFKPTTSADTHEPAVVAPQIKKSVTAGLNAHYVSDTVTDGMPIAANAPFTQVWTLRNPGPATWPAGCSVRFVGGDNMLNLDNNHTSSASDVAEATESNVVGREVQPGEQIAFKVIMKAPTRPGKAISYWRLKASDGTPFGHRLWCDIIVHANDPNPAARPLWSPNAQLMEIHRLQHTRQEAAMRQQRQQQQQVLMRQQQAAMMEAAMGQEAANKYLGHEGGPQSYYKQYQERMKALRAAQKERFERQGGYLAPFVPPPPPEASQQHPGLSTRAAFSEQANWQKQMQDFVSASSSSPMLYSAPGQQKPAETKIANSTKEESAAKEDSSELKSSQMIFPTLEKESPANSVTDVSKSAVNKGKAASVEDEEGSIAHAVKPSAHDASSATPSQAQSSAIETSDITADGFDDVANDLEVLSADGEVSDDDGFMTDEEWDVLDASDQETVVSSK